MPIAKVQLPDGRVGRFEVPEGTTPEQVLEFAQSMGQQSTPSTPPPVSPRQAEDESMAAYNAMVNAPPPTLQESVKDQLGLKDYKQRGTVLPIGETKEGKLEFAIPQIGVDILEAIGLPKHAMNGGSYTPQDVLGTATIMSPVSPATRAGETLIPGIVSHQKVKPKIPTADELKSAADAGYNKAANLGVDYTSAAVKDLADDIAGTLEKEGRIAELNPELFALLGKLRNPPPDSVASLNSIDAFRKRLGDIAGSVDPAKAAAASIAIKRLDEFLEANDPASLVARAATPTSGGAANLPGIGGAGAPSAEEVAREAATALSDARGNTAARFRSDRLTGVEDASELRASAANSGKNLGNTIRSRLASLLLSGPQSRGFSEKEIEAIRQVVEGTATANTLRRVSNMLGGGGGLGQSLMAALGSGVGGAVAGGPGYVVGAAVPAVVGSGTRSLYNNLTKRQLAQVDKLVRSRSPLYRSRVENPGMEVKVKEGRAALARLLLADMLADNDPQTNGRLARQLLAQ